VDEGFPFVATPPDGSLGYYNREAAAGAWTEKKIKHLELDVLVFFSTF